MEHIGSRISKENLIPFLNKLGAESNLCLYKIPHWNVNNIEWLLLQPN